MRRVGKICCFLALPAVFLCFFSVRRLFPFPRGDALTARRQAWAGVLRLWVCENLPCGTLDAWLNEASSAFERRNDGVYVQITTVSRASATDFAAAENPPDMLLLPPSLLDTPDGLLNRSGEYLTPVAMGGYAWAINRAMLPGLSPEGAPMRIPADSETASYSAALAALLCGDEAASGDVRRESRYGVDLGLPDASNRPSATAASLVRRELLPADGSQADENALRSFTRGEAAVTLVSQRELLRLSALADSGRAPDFAVVCTGYAFTDRLALFAAVDLPRDDLAARQALCEEFLALLLDDARQAQLNRVGCFRVTPGAALYATSSPLAPLERALTDAQPLFPPFFTSEWRARAQDVAQALLSGSGGAEDALRGAGIWLD